MHEKPYSSRNKKQKLSDINDQLMESEDEFFDPSKYRILYKTYSRRAPEISRFNNYYYDDSLFLADLPNVPRKNQIYKLLSF